MGFFLKKILKAMLRPFVRPMLVRMRLIIQDELERYGLVSQAKLDKAREELESYRLASQAEIDKAREELERAQRIFQTSASNASRQDIGRTYSDPEDAPYPHIRFSEGTPTAYTIPTNVQLRFENGDVFDGKVNFAHLAFLKLVKNFKISSIIDVGCGQGHELHLFKKLFPSAVGITLEVGSPEAWPRADYKPDFFGDYMDYVVEKPVDAIWCSHVLEHVNNVGLFLDKIHNDLKEGGVLAITVPYDDWNQPQDWICNGHYTRYHVPHLLFALINSGFDCRENIVYRVYNGQLSVLIKKKSIDTSNMTKFDLSRVAHKYFPKEAEHNGGSIVMTADSLHWD